MAWAVAEELSRRLYDTLQQTAINTFGSVRQRVAAQGSVREVVARVLREFRLAGLVATAPDSVVIFDAARLHSESWSPIAT